MKELFEFLWNMPASELIVFLVCLVVAMVVVFVFGSKLLDRWVSYGAKR